MKPKTIKELFAHAGNSTKLGAALNLHAQTVENWRTRGIPQKHWSAITKLYGVPPDTLYKMSLLAVEASKQK